MPETIDAGAPRPPLLAVRCGQVVYEHAWAWQRELVAARLRDEIPDVLLLLEHDRVYTAGRHADVGAHVLGTRGVRTVEIDRGGDVTYHGPGQLVVYPIVRLRDRVRVRAYVEALEESCVRTAARFGVEARPDRARTGVWVGDRKLVAIGIRVEAGVTSHGLAFNVTTDLDDFAGIVPCGLADAGVCSLASLGVEATVDDVARVLAPELAAALGSRLADGRLADLGLVSAPLPR